MLKYHQPIFGIVKKHKKLASTQIFEAPNNTQRLTIPRLQTPEV